MQPNTLGTKAKPGTSHNCGYDYTHVPQQLLQPPRSDAPGAQARAKRNRINLYAEYGIDYRDNRKHCIH